MSETIIQKLGEGSGNLYFKQTNKQISKTEKPSDDSNMQSGAENTTIVSLPLDKHLRSVGPFLMNESAE